MVVSAGNTYKQIAQHWLNFHHFTENTKSLLFLINYSIQESVIFTSSNLSKEAPSCMNSGRCFSQLNSQDFVMAAHKSEKQTKEEKTHKERDRHRHRVCQKRMLALQGLIQKYPLERVRTTYIYNNQPMNKLQRQNLGKILICHLGFFRDLKHPLCFGAAISSEAE